MNSNSQFAEESHPFPERPGAARSPRFEFPHQEVVPHREVALPALTLGRLHPPPVVMMAHEPDVFPTVPERVALTLSGHTHGGQVRLFGWSPVVPSKFGNRYAYGHVREDGRDLVVSGGIGCSILPVRLGVTPEITVVEMSA